MRTFNPLVNPLAACLVLSLALGACGGSRPVEEGVQDGTGDGGTVTAIPLDGDDDGITGAGFATDPQDDALDRRVIYFEYDSSTLTAEAQTIVTAHANYLLANPGVTLVLEGHADERGTREYNLALGEDRARAVFRFMQARGVGLEAVRTISYGEERPAALGHDENAWNLNRRVEILYGN